MATTPRPNRLRKSMIISTVAVLLVGAVALALVWSHAHRIYGGYVEHVAADRFGAEGERLAVTNVDVLSPDGERMLPGRLVVIDAGRITSISRPGQVPPGARVIDGTGHYLIPGLTDAHVHLRKQPNDLLLYVANGVTHVRDLAGSEADLVLREEIANGRIGPLLHVASPMLFNGGFAKRALHSFTAPRQAAGAPERAEKLVASLVAAGYDALKTYADLDLDTYRAINRVASTRGVYTIGHLPDGFDLEELASTEQREIAHIEELVKVLQFEFRAREAGDYASEFPAFVASRADAIIDALLASDITVNSTLWMMENVGDQVFGLEEALRRLPLAYANPAMVEGSPFVRQFGWLPGRNQFEAPADTSAEERQRIQALWDARAEAHRVLFRRMAQRGVRITAGTDATSHLVVPGFSMHDELASLVRNGMTPAQALRAATATPAAILGSDDGVLDAGRRADLVLLRADPLEDIRNTRAIEAVVLNGRWLDRAELDAMLDAVAAAHAASRNFDLAAYQQTAP
ncbi:MAG: amidohydrolase family protein [Pseudomonadales bacterium]|jgi:hypothetical protein|nr:amidohydrolase family protein [Pseudomonadales bacterium]